MNLRFQSDRTGTGLEGNPDILDVQDGEDRLRYGIRIALEFVREAREIGGAETWIYFIQEDCLDGAIKVGKAAEPPKRLKELQTGNPNRLKVRGIFWAPESLERVLHRAFAEDRLSGEWFAAGERLEILADALHHFTIRDPKASGRLFNLPWGDQFLVGLSLYEEPEAA